MRHTLAVVVVATSIVGASCSSSSSGQSSAVVTTARSNTSTPTSGTSDVSTTTVGSSTTSAAFSAPVAPPGDLYQPPSPLPAGKPGEIIWAERVNGINFQPPQTVWRFLYHSQDRTGRDVAVSAFAIVPDSAAPAGGRPVYAWAHGTAGLGDQCAPSRDVKNNIPSFAGEVAGGNALVVATDYEGLGTPGNHTYLVGRAEGQAVLDSIRAAAALPNAGPVGDVVLAGQSQGGGAALFAAQLAPSYAPELHLDGVLASAPAAELEQLATTESSSPYRGLLLLVASGFQAAYPTFDPSTFLTPAAVADLAKVANECVDATVSRYQQSSSSKVVTIDPSKVPAVTDLLVENSPGATAPDVPVLIVQGDHDEQIPVAVSASLAAKYCALGVAVQRSVYTGASHDGVLDAAHDDIVKWLNARYQHQTAPRSCT
jgi:pimeloyl-ACP methyl ester carboxylesterase